VRAFRNLLTVVVCGCAIWWSVAGPAIHMDAGRPRLAQEARWSGSLLRPGAAVEGAATVAERGGAGGRLWLTLVVGGHERLARSLRLVVNAVGADGRTRVLYSGSLAGFGSRRVGSLAPGASRRLHLRLWWPADRGDPRLAGTRLTTRLRWTLA
jgi:hypothetical protein